MIRLNTKLIDNPEVALETMMAVTAAMYTGINKDTPVGEAREVAELCAAMWRICDALRGICGR